MKEKFDILDINGTPTGQTAVKGTPLSDGLYYLGIHVYIYNSGGEFLLQQRSYDKEFLPGGWDVLLEHVIAGETSSDGAIRGVKEEIGLSVTEHSIRFAGRYVWDAYHHMIDIYFLNADIAINNLTLQSTEVINAKMIPLEEMLRHVSNMDYRPAEYRRFILNEINRISGEIQVKNHV